MKKINILILTGIIFLLIVLNPNNNKKINNENIKYAITLDGVKQNSFPSKGLYEVTVKCSNGNGRWNYKNWELVIIDDDNISTFLTCDISFDTIEKVNLSNKIEGFVGTIQGNGRVVNEPINDYRYEGKNPNNYVWFNNELWRIIGVFNENTHGIENKKLVKIVRNESIGALSWSVPNNSDWANSTLYKLLNSIENDSNSGAYYTKTDGSDSGYCYVSSLKSGNCNYSQKGIDEFYRRMIKKVIWKVGGISNINSSNAVSEKYYTSERGNETGNNNAYAKEVSSHIGLMYPSDYGYSVLDSDCPRSIPISQFHNNSSCASNSWIYGQGEEWLLFHLTTNDGYVCYLSSYGYVGFNTNSYTSAAVRPTLYLNESVYVLDGDGSITDPYIIAMDEV